MPAKAGGRVAVRQVRAALPPSQRQAVSDVNVGQGVVDLHNPKRRLKRQGTWLGSNPPLSLLAAQLALSDNPRIQGFDATDDGIQARDIETVAGAPPRNFFVDHDVAGLRPREIQFVDHLSDCRFNVGGQADRSPLDAPGRVQQR